MTNRLADAISPYLRSHAGNPVDWYPWGEAAFAEAARRGVPVLVSIGYSTCHWCHVMARETFSDPGLAARLNARFVAVKVDREEHPDVDASYLAAAGVFTPNLGWPLNVFVTPAGRAFFAGTYFPPAPLPGHPSFAQVLDAVSEAWTERREEVESNAARVSEALTAAAAPGSAPGGDLPDAAALDGVVAALAGYEDAGYGGFGSAPKFPMAPVLAFLLEHGAADAGAFGLAARTLAAMAASPLRDRVEGGFFRYATQRDWSEPHYERMLYDNAQLLEAYTRWWQADPTDEAATTAAGLAGFLTGVLQLPAGGFASAQDSESTVDGRRVEGGYYALDADARGSQSPPALDEKVLTGWNGLAIGALGRAGLALGRPDWTQAASRAADHLLERHMSADGTLLRASIGDRSSDAVATLEDYGMFAGGLLELALATGEVRYAQAARRLVDSTMAAAASVSGTGSLAGTAPVPETPPAPFAVPGGADPVLAAQGLAITADPSEGAYPSGLTAVAAAAHTLYLLTADGAYLAAARATMARVAAAALAQPIAFGAALRLMSVLQRPVEQLVVVVPDGPEAERRDATGGASLVDLARHSTRALAVVLRESEAQAFTEAGFELFAARGIRDGMPTAYLCRDFVCRLPVTDASELAAP